MKKSLIITLLTLFSIATFAQKKVKMNGNKSIVKKEYQITDYSSLGISIDSEVHYLQTESGAPTLSIEIDENLLEHLSVEIDGNSLTIKPQDRKKLNPSKCIIRTNSKVLAEIELAGKVNTNINGKLTTNKLELSLAGKAIVTCTQLVANSTQINIAGGAKVTLEGTAQDSEYNIAGGGTINSVKLLQDKVEVNIAGGGTTELYAKDELNCNIAATGRVSYTGNPTVKKSIVGGGSVNKID